MKEIPTFRDIKQAHKRIRSSTHRTPVWTNRQVDDRADTKVFFKCENFQRVGAFKFRGACNAIFSLTEAEASRGVATHSSGNHGQAVALAAQQRGVPAHIVMPENAPAVKKKAVEGYEADITFCESTQQAREATLEKIVSQTGAVFIPPYDHPKIIAGQGTAAVELLHDQPDLTHILAPVGGGGLLSGTAIAAKGINPKINVLGCEPAMADDAFRSLKTGSLQPTPTTETVADGLRTSLSELTFSCIKKQVDDIITVSEEHIVDAMRFVWERMNIIIEASSAVPVAVLLQHKIDLRNQKIGLIISGGNVDLDHLPWHG